jgi:hypothetical protein
MTPDLAALVAPDPMEVGAVWANIVERGLHATITRLTTLPVPVGRAS